MVVAEFTAPAGAMRVMPDEVRTVPPEESTSPAALVSGHAWQVEHEGAIPCPWRLAPWQVVHFNTAVAGVAAKASYAGPCTAGSVKFGWLCGVAEKIATTYLSALPESWQKPVPEQSPAHPSKYCAVAAFSASPVVPHG